MSGHSESCGHKLSLSLVAKNVIKPGSVWFSQQLILKVCILEEFLDFSVTAKTMINISREFTSVFSCIKLAVYIGLEDSSNFVDRLVHAEPRIEMAELAFRVLHWWVEEKGSNAHRPRLNNVIEYDFKWKRVSPRLACGDYD